jgi:hypothetical protein
MSYDKCLLAAANQAAGVVHRGTKNSFPRAGGFFKRFKRALLGNGAREAGSILQKAVFSDLGEGDFAANIA